jgi:hypothetical protein
MNFLLKWELQNTTRAKEHKRLFKSKLKKMHLRDAFYNRGVCEQWKITNLQKKIDKTIELDSKFAKKHIIAELNIS